MLIYQRVNALNPNRTHRIHVLMLYMVTFTINIPQMLANIPAPWILWGMICSIAVSDYRRGYVLSYFLQYIFHFFAHMLVLSPFWRVSQDESANGIRLLLADSVSAVFYPMKFHEIPRYSWFASHIFHPFHPFHIFSYLFHHFSYFMMGIQKCPGPPGRTSPGIP